MRQPRDFQVLGSVFLCSRKIAALLDDAGLGKTLVVLLAVIRMNLKRVLVIGPAVAGVSWPREVETWAPGRTYRRITTEDTVTSLFPPGIYFVSYDLLSQKSNAKLCETLIQCPTWDAIVIDEAQAIKNPASNRTRAIYGRTGRGQKDPGAIVSNAERIWILSGTLTPNSSVEAYPHVRALFPQALAGIPAFKNGVDLLSFQDRFCVVEDTRFGRIVTGSKNQAELRGALVPYVMRRLKTQVMPELAPMEWFTAPLQLAPGLIDAIYKRALAERLVKIGANGATTFHGEDELAAHLLEQLETSYPAARRVLGLAKVGAAAEWIIDRLEAGTPKIVVFAHHVEVIARLTDALANYNPVVLTGETSLTERHKAVDTFQYDGKCRLFVGNYHAAGTAITLTAASTVFFVEYSGTPGVNLQAASRTHRIGQHDGVQVYFACVPGSLDERIAETAERRAREIADLFD